MFFHLIGECYLVNGVSGGAIYHLTGKEIIRLEKTESELLLRAEKGEDCGDEPLLEQLSEMGWGILSKENFFVDKMRPYNDFLLLRPDLRPPALQTAYLQLTDRCGFSHEICRCMFCTPCRTRKNAGNEIKAEQWKSIIEKLCLAGVRNLILTGGDLRFYEGLTELITECRSRELGCTVVLNHYDKETAAGLPKDISVIIYACQEENMEDYRRLWTDRPDAAVILNERTGRLYEEKKESVTPRVMVSHTDEICLGETKIVPSDMEQFYQKKDTNACLNGKMYILADGSLVPCFQKDDVILGNLLRGDFSSIYKKLVDEYWNQPVRHEKCNACQWYYGCSVCMCMEPEKQCVCT